MIKNARELYVLDFNDKIFTIEILSEVKTPKPLENTMKLVSDDYEQEIHFPDHMLPDRIPLIERTIKFSINDQAEMNNMSVVLSTDEYGSLLNFINKTIQRQY